MRTEHRPLGPIAAARAVVLAIVLALGTTAHAGPTDDHDADVEDAAHDVVDTRAVVPVALRRGGPAIADVLAAAYRAAGLDREPTRGWIRRARLAGLVPWLSVRTGRDTNWQDDDGVVDHGMALEVRATWRLDRLVFDGRELQVASVEAARRRERRQLAGTVIQAYFTWRRARGDASEAAATLDALTDGWFSDALPVRQ